MHRNSTHLRSDPFKTQRVIYYVILISIIVVVVASVVYSMFYISAEGFLKADELRVKSQYGGYVKKLYVDVGDSVKAGDPVATLSDFKGGDTTIRARMVGSEENWEIVEKFCNEGEIISPYEQIVLLADRNYYILAFFKDSVINELFCNFPVSVVFKNGGRYTGYIYKIYPVVYPINREDRFYRTDMRFVPVIIKLNNFNGSKYFYNARARVFLSKLELFKWKRKKTH